MPPELSARAKQDIEEAVVKSESKFAIRKLASLLTFAFVAYKIIKKDKKGGRAEAMSDNQGNQADSDS